jgi:hypothetical protein
MTVLITGNHEITQQNKPSRQTAKERRANSNPVLIGILTGMVSPIIGSIFAIRQRCWELAVVAWVPVLMWAITEVDTEGPQRLQRKYAAQLAAGFLTGAVALVKKNEAKKSEVGK